ncbi:hypothetical protein [Anaerosporobacter sp.]|uniref:hypothetical protein n=1 Tax=Anaerosporobacter sp. TaxID=1872529 RepID=UPI00286F858A|nr:hypothetical protein [Anaerosporobacter sp.]
MFFSKIENVELVLPFKSKANKEEFEAGVIEIEAYGNVFGEEKYCYAMYDMTDAKMYVNKDYEDIISLLRNSTGKNIKVNFKIKKGKVKDFEIDLESLALAYNDERFCKLDLLASGLNDKDVWR